MRRNKAYSHCVHCGLIITHPDSIARGMGDVCWNKTHPTDFDGNPIKRGHQFFLDADPLKEGLIAKRIDNLYVNVPHTVIKQSPSGFEIGYSGNGPSDLALNTLLLFTDPKTASVLHQAFMFQFISNMPASGGIVPADAIKKWIAISCSNRSVVQYSFF